METFTTVIGKLFELADLSNDYDLFVQSWNVSLYMGIQIFNNFSEMVGSDVFYEFIL